MAGMFDTVSVKAAYAHMERIHGKFMEYHTAYSRYPQNLDELKSFLHSEFDKPIEQVMTDPWKKPYIFLTSNYEIYSFGPDKKQNTKDDIGISYPPHIQARKTVTVEQQQFYVNWQRTYEARQKSMKREHK